MSSSHVTGGSEAERNPSGTRLFQQRYIIRDIRTRLVRVPSHGQPPSPPRPPTQENFALEARQMSAPGSHVVARLPQRGRTTGALQRVRGKAFVVFTIYPVIEVLQPALVTAAVWCSAEWLLMLLGAGLCVPCPSSPSNPT